MGGFFVNVFVRSDDQGAVVSAVKEVLKGCYTPQELRSQAATAPIAYVAPAVNGWVGVYDRQSEDQDTALAEGIAMDLSNRLKTVVTSFLVHDGDVLMYWLAVDGDIIDRFTSIPDYFDDDFPDDEREALRGNPRLLAAACDKPEAEAALREVLTDEEDDAYGLISRLSAILGMANADVGFYYLSEPAEPVAGWSEFVAIAAGDLLA